MDRYGCIFLNFTDMHTEFAFIAAVVFCQMINCRVADRSIVSNHFLSLILPAYNEALRLPVALGRALAGFLKDQFLCLRSPGRLKMAAPTAPWR